MKISIKVLFVLSAMFLLSSNSYATSYLSNLTGTYGDASHETPKWQKLSFNNGDSGDYGVLWSVDGGLNWGNEDLYVGQTVSFMFGMHKDSLGTHYLDLSKTWLDWDKNGMFDEDEVIGYYTNTVQEIQMNPVTDATNATPNPADFIFYSSDFEITDDYIGDLYLRSRVTCSESLTGALGGSWNDQWNESYYSRFKDGFSAIGTYGQGEVEEWVISVNAAPVPEPATLFLLGSGLLGVLGVKRRNK